MLSISQGTSQASDEPDANLVRSLLAARRELLATNRHLDSLLQGLRARVPAPVRVLPMVLGARAWDNWLLHQVHRNYGYFAGGERVGSTSGVAPPTVDATLALAVLHQYHPSRHGQHAATDARSQRNRQLADGKWFLGSTDRTYWELIDLENANHHQQQRQENPHAAMSTASSSPHSSDTAVTAANWTLALCHQRHHSNNYLLRYRGPWLV